MTVKDYVNCIGIIDGDRIVARHVRSRYAGDQVVDPLHYLLTLNRQPAVLDHSNVYCDWNLPLASDVLRSQLERRHSSPGSVRQRVGVLPLLRAHPVASVARTIE